MSKYSEHPFAAWIGALATLNAVALDGAKNTDIKLSGLGAKRFALGIHESAPLLAILAEDQAAFQAVKWTSAALILNKDYSDWIALSAKDIRPGNPSSGDASPMRLFIPVELGRLTAWKEMDKNTKLFIGIMSEKKMNGLLELQGSPFMELNAIIMAAGDSKTGTRRPQNKLSKDQLIIPSAAM